MNHRAPRDECQKSMYPGKKKRQLKRYQLSFVNIFDMSRNCESVVMATASAVMVLFGMLVMASATFVAFLMVVLMAVAVCL